MVAHGEVRATRRTGIPWIPEPSAQSSLIKRDPSAVQQRPRAAGSCASHFAVEAVLGSAHEEVALRHEIGCVQSRCTTAFHLLPGDLEPIGRSCPRGTGETNAEGPPGAPAMRRPTHATSRVALRNPRASPSASSVRRFSTVLGWAARDPDLTTDSSHGVSPRTTSSGGSRGLARYVEAGYGVGVDCSLDTAPRRRLRRPRPPSSRSSRLRCRTEPTMSVPIFGCRRPPGSACPACCSLPSPRPNRSRARYARRSPTRPAPAAPSRSSRSSSHRHDPHQRPQPRPETLSSESPLSRIPSQEQEQAR